MWHNKSKFKPRERQGWALDGRGVKGEGRLLRGGDLLAALRVKRKRKQPRSKVLLERLTGRKAQRYEIRLKVVALQNAWLQVHCWEIVFVQTYLYLNSSSVSRILLTRVSLDWYQQYLLYDVWDEAGRTKIVIFYNNNQSHALNCRLLVLEHFRQVRETYRETDRLQCCHDITWQRQEWGATGIPKLRS